MAVQRSVARHLLSHSATEQANGVALAAGNNTSPRDKNEAARVATKLYGRTSTGSLAKSNIKEVPDACPDVKWGGWGKRCARVECAEWMPEDDAKS